MQRSDQHLTVTLQRFTIISIILALLASIVLILPASSVQAQDSSNLLQNGGFEAPFVAIGGVSTKQVASGWQPWHIRATPGSPSSENLEPDYQPAREKRVRSGSSAQEYNTFFATHEGGVFQRVPVTAGNQLRFSVFAYLYSSADFENPDVSTNPQGVRISVGIDPNGGTDGASSTIIWSTPQEYYDEYREQTVTATAAANSVTVFVRSTVENAPGLHQVFVDDARLVIVGQSDVTPIPITASPTQDVITTPLPVVTTPPVLVITATPSSPQPTPQRTPISAEFPNELVHTVAFGDTVSALATRYNSNIDAIIDYNGLDAGGLIFVNQRLLIPVRAGQGTPINPPTAAPVGNVGQGGPVVPADGTYVVQNGDNLFRIALRFNITVETLAQFNGILNPNQIFVGQRIRIPTSTQPAQPANPNPIVDSRGNVIHVVQAGENAFRIGLRYNITWDRLARANGLVNPNLIFVGQRLIIPR